MTSLLRRLRGTREGRVLALALAVLVVAVVALALGFGRTDHVRTATVVSETTSTTAPPTTEATTVVPVVTEAPAAPDTEPPPAPTDPQPVPQPEPPPPTDPPAPPPPAYPTAATTGVPARTALQPSGGFTVTDAGAVIDGLDISGCVTVNAANVVIRNSRVRCSGSYGIRNLDAPNLLIDHVEIDGGRSPDTIAVAGDNITILAADIHGVGDGPRAGSNTLIKDSYIHDLAVGNGSHNDGIQSTAGTNIVIIGNNIQNPSSQTSAILIGADLGDISAVLIAGNLLNGGSFTVYAGNDPGHRCTNVTIRDNAFGADYLYGVRNTNVPITWTGNYDAATGAPV